MKPIIKFATCILLTSALFFVACKKEKPISSVVTPPPPPPPPSGKTIKVRVLEYGSDQPIEGATLKVCTAPQFPAACGRPITNVITNSNGEGFFIANQFRAYALKDGYFNSFFDPCFITYFGNDTILYNMGINTADSFIIRIVPKIDFLIHVKDSTGAGSTGEISMVGDVDFNNCVRIGGGNWKLRRGIDTTIRLTNYYGNTNYIIMVGNNYDSDCGCFQTIFYDQVKYVAKGSSTILNITY